MNFTAARPVKILGVNPPTYSSPFHQLATSCTPGLQLAAGASCTTTVDFQPAATGPATNTIGLTWRPADFPAAAGTTTFNTTLTGTGTAVGTQATTAQLTYYTTTSELEAPPVRAGNQVVLVATITPDASGGPAQGSVNFFDTGTDLGSVSLGTSHTSSYAILFTTLTAGPHTITAVYSGDPQFNDNTTNTLHITVTT